MAQAASSDALLGPRMTLEEWADLPDSVPGEFVDGRLVEEEMPELVHEVIVTWLVHVFLTWRSNAIVGGSDAKFACRRIVGANPMPRYSFLA
jgi:hypothetical protein